MDGGIYSNSLVDNWIGKSVLGRIPRTTRISPTQYGNPHTWITWNLPILFSSLGPDHTTSTSHALFHFSTISLPPQPSPTLPRLPCCHVASSLLLSTLPLPLPLFVTRDPYPCSQSPLLCHQHITWTQSLNLVTKPQTITFSNFEILFWRHFEDM